MTIVMAIYPVFHLFRYVMIFVAIIFLVIKTFAGKVITTAPCVTKKVTGFAA